MQIDKDFEEGLLGIAFHPKFESNGKFYIYYSRQGPKCSILSEFEVKDGKPTLDSERLLLQIGQPYGNHDSGLPLFGPDGLLHISTGDIKKGQAFQPTHFTQRPDGEIWALSWDGRIYEMVKGEPSG